MHRIFFFLVAVTATSACGRPPPKTQAPAAPTTTTTAVAHCAAEQFVACESGEACARRQGKHVRTHACHDRAADACAALSCAHGCNIHAGWDGTKDVFCALGAAGASDMKRCGGFSNWACPENTRCQRPDPQIAGFDATGECVPSS